MPADWKGAASTSRRESLKQSPGFPGEAGVEPGAGGLEATATGGQSRPDRMSPGSHRSRDINCMVRHGRLQPVNRLPGFGTSLLEELRLVQAKTTKTLALP